MSRNAAATCRATAVRPIEDEPRRTPAVSHSLERRRETAELRRYAMDRDPAARDRLVARYLPLADAIARRFDRGGRVPLEDLKQIAALGLIKALDRYDPDNGAAFSSYAVPTMQGEIRRYFRDFTWTVRPPRELQERAMRAERERERLTNELGRTPTANELAARLDCTTEELIDATEASHARDGDSFDGPAGGAQDDEGALTLTDRLGGEDAGYAHAEAAATLDRLLGTASERERLVLELRFHKDLTQAEIGRRIGCSQMHVSRILRTTLARLADYATATPETLDDLIRNPGVSAGALVLD